MTEGLAAVLSIIFTTGNMATYVFICFEFPRTGVYDSDPFWLVIIKLWGGIFTFILSFVFYALVFSLFIEESI